jgi:hypothetical protein
MWNPDLRLPRFDKVAMKGPGIDVQYNGKDQLEKISDGPGGIKINVELLPLESNRPVHVETERHELVNTPGSYYLVVRELTANEKGSTAPAVNITIKLPPDLDADVRTYYAAHEFRRVPGINRWTFTGTMLPGQGVDLLFGVRAARTHV